MDILNKEITLVYNHALIRRAVTSYWRRSLGKYYPLALALIAFSFFTTLHDNGWWRGFNACALLFSVAFPALVYLVHYRNSMAKFKQMGAPEAKLILTQESFTISSGAGSSTLPWSSVKEIWQFGSFWLVLFSKAHFWTLPLHSLSEQEKLFIREQASKAGGKIR